MRYSIAMTDLMHRHQVRHLVRPDGQEDLCFAIWYPGTGATRLTALLQKPILPRVDERILHGNVELTSHYFERALLAARQARGGLAFLHSHPRAGWQPMSRDDVSTERLMAASAFGATGLPLVGLTLGARTETWSGRFWVRTGPRTYRRQWCESVRVVGEHLSIDYYDKLRPRPMPHQSQLRTVAAWGTETQDGLARLRVGVVGLGSVGSIVAEGLARMGVQHIQLLDFDSIAEVNLDRTLHAGMADARAGRAKVEVAARALRRSGTAHGFRVSSNEYSICEAEGLSLALDCDVLFSCVDRPWARSVLNFLAYAHLVPVVDGGIHASQTPSGRLRGADWKAHTVTYGHRCLLCLRQYNPGLVAVEQAGLLDDSSYIAGLAKDHPLRATENVFGFSLALASLELMQLIGLLAHTGVVPQNYHLVTGKIDLGRHVCDRGCLFPAFTAKGDGAGHPGTGEHVAAAAARKKRAQLLE